MLNSARKLSSNFNHYDTQQQFGNNNRILLSTTRTFLTEQPTKKNNQKNIQKIENLFNVVPKSVSQKEAKSSIQTGPNFSKLNSNSLHSDRANQQTLNNLNQHEKAQQTNVKLQNQISIGQIGSPQNKANRIVTFKEKKKSLMIDPIQENLVTPKLLSPKLNSPPSILKKKFGLNMKNSSSSSINNDPPSKLKTFGSFRSIKMLKSLRSSEIKNFNPEILSVRHFSQSEIDKYTQRVCAAEIKRKENLENQMDNKEQMLRNSNFSNSRRNLKSFATLSPSVQSRRDSTKTQDSNIYLRLGKIATVICETIGQLKNILKDSTKKNKLRVIHQLFSNETVLEEVILNKKKTDFNPKLSPDGIVNFIISKPQLINDMIGICQIFQQDLVSYCTKIIDQGISNNQENYFDNNKNLNRKIDDSILKYGKIPEELIANIQKMQSFVEIEKDKKNIVTELNQLLAKDNVRKELINPVIRHNYRKLRALFSCWNEYDNEKDQ